MVTGKMSASESAPRRRLEDVGRRLLSNINIREFDKGSLFTAFFNKFTQSVLLYGSSRRGLSVWEAEGSNKSAHK